LSVAAAAFGAFPLSLPHLFYHFSECCCAGASILMAITVRGESVLTKIKFCQPNPIKYLVNCANQVVNLMFAKFLIEL